MAPSDYIQARSITTSPDENNKKAEDYVTIIDGYPYMPFLKLDPNDTASIQEVAAKILSLATSSSSTTTEEDDEDDEERTTITTTNIDPNTLSVDVVIGGITNKLFKVSGIKHKPPGSNPDNDSVLIRVFGGHGLIDRDVETSTHAALAKTHIAVPYLGRFENGRIEDWCENMPPLSSTQLADVTVSTQIALSLANLHSKFQVPWELQPYHDPNQTPTLWSQLESWWNQAIESTTTTTNGHSSALIQSLQELELERFSTEVFWLRETVIATEHAKVGFCHNDLLAANILYCPDTETIQLVDFEYGGINYMVRFVIARRREKNVRLLHFKRVTINLKSFGFFLSLSLVKTMTYDMDTGL